MSQARTDLLSRIAALRECLTETVLVDGLPTDRRRNSVAAMFRNGLAVLAFAIMEAYIKDRTAETLNSFNNSVRFGDLSDKLQTATTLGALKAILFRASNVERADQVAWTLAKLPVIANAATNVTALSPFSFGQGRSNVSAEDISDILSAFGIDGGWAAITAIAKRVGIGGVADYSQSFKSLAGRRHAAAHDITANILLSELTNSVTEIIGICCAFDLLLSHSLSLHNLNQIPNKLSGLVKHGDIKIRFISAHPTLANTFREQVEASGGLLVHRTVKNHSTLAAAETTALNNAQLQRQQLVFLDSRALPEKWITW
jgi:hypothetical protein